MTRIDRLEDLHTLVLVVHSGSLSAAARTLGLTTNAVSRRVQRLERRLGVTLLHRTTRSLRLTEEGRRLYERAVRVMRELQEAEEELSVDSAALRGMVRVAVPAALATGALWGLLGSLTREHPRLRVQMRVLNGPTDLATLLTREALDIAVHVGEPRDSSLHGRRLGTVSWVLAAAPPYLERHGRPETPEELARHQCLRFLSDLPQSTWTIETPEGGEVVVPIGGALECDDSRALGEAVYAGAGIGVRPAREVARAVANGTLEEVLPGYRFARAPLHALFPAGRDRLPHVRAVLDVLAAAALDVL